MDEKVQEQVQNPGMNGILDLATRIRNEYGQRDGQINNANNPIGNFRAWSRAFDLASQILGSKQNLVGGQPVSIEQAQEAAEATDNTQPEFKQDQPLQKEVLYVPTDNSFMQPGAYIGGNPNRLPGPETLNTAPTQQNFLPNVARTFDTPRISDNVIKYLGG